MAVPGRRPAIGAHKRLPRLLVAVSVPIIAISWHSSFRPGAWVAPRGGGSSPEPQHILVGGQRYVRPSPSARSRIARAGIIDDFENGLGLMDPARNSNDDMQEGVRLVERAARQGHPEACNTMGMLTVQGINGVLRNPLQAYDWFEAASDNGFIDATFNMGLMKLDGDGVPTDKFGAAKLFRKAADGGHEDAMVHLATMLVKGDGVPKDMQLGAQWFIKLCQKGNHWDALMEQISNGSLDTETATQLQAKIKELQELNELNPTMEARKGDKENL
eukprot:TRINITY_DN24972_c0_g1_i1.p1 TRINITY_DN24972_c0_g1~~TRINITY_DN24972_c0_g1_i1.p1  ORF type:complete len:274 (+),score=65.48 TRINITY_DN24972_c0_g1_i1:125-946(+)